MPRAPCTTFLRHVDSVDIKGLLLGPMAGPDWARCLLPHLSDVMSGLALAPRTLSCAGLVRLPAVDPTTRSRGVGIDGPVPPRALRGDALHCIAHIMCTIITSTHVRVHYTTTRDATSAWHHHEMHVAPRGQPRYGAQRMFSCPHQSSHRPVCASITRQPATLPPYDTTMNYMAPQRGQPRYGAQRMFSCPQQSM